MASATQRKEIQVRVSDDALTAELTIPGGADPATVSVDACMLQLSGAGLQVTKAMSQRVEALVAEFAAAPEADACLRFEGTPAEPGEPGRFEWASGCEPEGEAAAPVDEQGRVDYYERQSFTTVAAHQPIGRVVPPTEGKEGMDLRGEPIPVKDGKPATIAADPQTISVEADGTCRSLIDGVVRTRGTKIWISPYLEIDGYVDFHSGNIEFQGDVTIRKGVRDRFRVVTSGDLVVQQLIEAAHLEAGGDFRAAGGMAAKGRGGLRVGQDLVARYLDSVIGSVGRDATIEREMIQCDLAIGGDLRILRGALIGGVTRVGGTAHLPELGSRAHLKTELILGTLPELDKLLTRLQEHIEYLDAELTKIQAEIDQLVARPTGQPDEADRLRELMNTAPTIEQKIEAAKRRSDLLRDRYAKESRVELRVNRAVHCGVMIQVDQQQLLFKESINASLRLTRANDQRLLLAVGSGNLKPVKQIPGIRVIQAAADPDAA